jgi:DNA modification methylase
MRSVVSFPGVTLYNADCLDVLQASRADDINAVITDPPYNIAQGSAFVRAGTSVVADGKEGMNVGDTWAWVKSLDGRVSVGCNVACFHKRGDCPPEPIKVWHKYYLIKIAPPPTPRPCFVSGVEECSIGSFPGKRRWFGTGYEVNYWLGRSAGKERRATKHPAEKPLGAMLTLVRCLCPPGGLCIDPYMGSGTTAIACIQTGRRFIGVEIYPDYFAMAVERIERELRKPDMFTAVPVRPRLTLF